MILLAAFAAVACGLSLLRFFGARGAFLLGGGVAVGLGLSGTLWSAGLLLFGATGPWTDLILLAAAAILYKLYKTSDTRRPMPAAPWWLAAAVAVAALIVCGLFVEHSLRYPDGGWDAVAIWNFRARGLFAAPHRLREVLTPELRFLHPDYPLLLPGLVAHLWFALGTHAEWVPIAVSFLFGAACVAALAGAVSDRCGPVAGLAAALLLLGTPELLLLTWSQYADLKLAALLLVAVVLATDERFVAAGLVAGLCAYTKNEGVIEVAALFVAVLIASGRRALLRLAAGAALPLALLVYFKLHWAPPNDLISNTTLTPVLRALPWRVTAVVRGFAAQVIDFPHWGVALAFVLALWVARWRTRRRRTVAGLFVALALVPFFAIFVATPLEIGQHIRDSLDRLLFQLWPSLIYATAISLAPEAAARGDAAPPPAVAGSA